MTPEQATRHLRRAIEVARRAIDLGRYPFGAILVAPAGVPSNGKKWPPH